MSKHPAWWPTAEQKARADLSTQPGLSVLGDATDDALVQALLVLTHRIHASETAKMAELDRTADLRAQRELVKAEVLRRMGGAR